MDLFVDIYNHAILVLHELKTGIVFMEKLKHRRKAKPVAQEWSGYFTHSGGKPGLSPRITGPELSAHDDITAGLSIKGKENVTVKYPPPTAHGRKEAWKTRTKSLGSSCCKDRVGSNELNLYHFDQNKKLLKK